MMTRIERIYVDGNFKKKIEIESINRGFRSVIEFTRELANKDDDLFKLFKDVKKENNNRRMGFDFP